MNKKGPLLHYMEALGTKPEDIMLKWFNVAWLRRHSRSLQSTRSWMSKKMGTWRKTQIFDYLTALRVNGRLKSQEIIKEEERRWSERDGKTKEEDERPFLKEGPKVLDCKTPFCDPLLNSKFQCDSFNPRLSVTLAVQHRVRFNAAQQLQHVSLLRCLSSQSALSNSGALRSSRTSCRSHRSGDKRELLHVGQKVLRFVPWNSFGTCSSVVPAAAGSDAFDSSFLECESVQSRVSHVMLSPARHHTSFGHSSVARGGARGVALCCSCCGSGLVDGESDIYGRCMSGTHGCDMFNSCVVHGEGQVAKRVHQGVGETKSKRTCTRSGVRQPLEGLMPVGDELATDPRRVSEKVHVEIRDGRTCATEYGTRLFEFGKGCEVVVKIPCVPDKALMVGVFVSPRPGVPLRETWGWKPLLHTPSSGVWASWVSRGTYRTAWAVCPWSGCQCSYSYGQGPGIGPHTGRGCFRYLVSVWRALVPLLSPWCADGDVPSAANLNLYEGSRSHVSWHCDDEPLLEVSVIQSSLYL